MYPYQPVEEAVEERTGADGVHRGAARYARAWQCCAVLWPVTGTFIASASCSKGISSVVRVPGMKKVNACAQGRQCTLAAFGKEVPPCVGQPI